MSGEVGYYKIIGWLKTKDSVGFKAKPPKDLHFGTIRDRIRTFYKDYCYQAEDPRLIKIMYFYADRTYEVTEDFRFPELKKLIRNRKKA